MNKADLDKAASALANWKQKLSTDKANGAVTEAAAIQETVIALAHAGLRLERQKLADLAESAKGLRLTEVVPEDESQGFVIRETTGEVVRPKG